MNLPISVYVSDGNIYYSFELNRKVTVFTGHSGTGKSTLTRVVTGKTIEKGYVERISDKRYTLIAIDYNNWESVYEGLLLVSKTKDERFIFIFDDVDFVLSGQFAGRFKNDLWNLYIIINRFENMKEVSLSSIPFSIYSIYNIISREKEHWIEPKYNLISSEDVYYDCIITEDQSLGYRFLLNYNKNISTSKGKDNIPKLLFKHKDLLDGKKVLVFADLASYGSSLGNLVSLADMSGLDVSLVENYECFEYLILNSHMLLKSQDVRSCLESSKTIDTLVKYQSNEKMYEDLIQKVTDDKLYRLRHGLGSKLKDCYIKDCCSIPKKCELYEEGNKKELMFHKTPWQKLFECIQNSNLIKID